MPDPKALGTIAVLHATAASGPVWPGSENRGGLECRTREGVKRLPGTGERLGPVSESAQTIEAISGKFKRFLPADR